MTDSSISDAAKAVVRRNTEEVQGRGTFELFEELFADDFLDHTPQPGGTPDKAGARNLYRRLRAAFPDFHAEIHWQRADGDVVTTYKSYPGTHNGEFLGIAPTGRKVQSELIYVVGYADPIAPWLVDHLRRRPPDRPPRQRGSARARRLAALGDASLRSAGMRRISPRPSVASFARPHPIGARDQNRATLVTPTASIPGATTILR